MPLVPRWTQLPASQEVKAGARSISLGEGTSGIGSGLQLVRVASVFPQYITLGNTLGVLLLKILLIP